MWYIFPQIKGLGYSYLSRKFAISSLKEAEAYMVHPVLGVRLRECTQLVILVEGRSIEEIFGHTDSLKFRSSMTLFCHSTTDNQIFNLAIEKYCGGYDPLTMERL